jgi:hypothetical protein
MPTTLSTYTLTLTETERQRLDTNEGLRHDLASVAERGWDGPAGRALLAYAMNEIVRPVVRDLGVYGAAGEFAEATGWAVAWEALSEPGLAEQPRPWGMVSIRVRRAVLGERMADLYGTSPAAAWRIRKRDRLGANESGPRRGEWNQVADRGALRPPLSLSRLLGTGYDCPDEAAHRAPSPHLDILTDLLVRHGWPESQARQTVLHVAEYATQNQPQSTAAPGWRELAACIGIPHWQARRLTVLLLGAPGWPGLAERLGTGGPDALQGPVIAAAVRATRVESVGSPPRAARLACAAAEPPVLIAS